MSYLADELTVVGQWLSPDPAMPDFFTTGLAGGVFEPRNLATYSYAWNNPVGAKDPDGLAVETPWGVWNVVLKEVDHVANVGRALNCFAGETLVETKQGPREIEAIVEGDWVWAKDELSGKEGWYPVRGVFRKHGQTLLAMGFSDGASVGVRADAVEAHDGLPLRG